MTISPCSTILITGGAGFIGSSLAKRCLADGHTVIISDNLSTGYRHNLPPQATFIEGDIASEAYVKKLPWDTIDAVLHLAAQASGEISRSHPLLDLDSNVRGTFLLLKEAADHGIKRFLYASSMAAYGNQPCEQVTERTPLLPLSFYGISKKCAEEYVNWFQQHGLSTTTFRMFSVYGPGQDLTNMQQGMVSIFLSMLLANQDIHVKGSADRFRDFIHIDDVLAAWMLALDSRAADGKTYNLGTGTKTTVGQLVTTLIAAAGKTPDYPVRFAGSTPDDQLGLYADVNALKRDLCWQPAIPLQLGLSNMVAAIRAEEVEPQHG